MDHLLYVSDVYCPWCYAFGEVFDELLERHPLPVKVLPGELVEPGSTLDDMVLEMPNIKAFFKRLGETTGRSVGDSYLALLEPGKGDMSMDSRAMSVPLTALKRLAPGKEKEQLEALQKALFLDGQDVLDPYVQARACHVDEEALILECSKAEVKEDADRARKEALELLGEFVIYPTLFLVKDDGCRILVARGCTDFSQALKRLEKGLSATA